MSAIRAIPVIAVLVTTTAVMGAGASKVLAKLSSVQFPHERHARLFDTCDACHGGVRQAGGRTFPDPSFCAACHDGNVQPRIEWSPPTEPPATNLRFDHVEHPAIDCANCHQEPGAERMAVQRAVVGQCTPCHGLEDPHYGSVETDCSTCHLALAEATRLTGGDIAAFPAPPAHAEPGWAERGGHGLQAYEPVEAPAPAGVAAFCIQCHVDAPEQPAIQALQPDSRSLIHEAALQGPTTHRDPDFLQRHGDLVQRTPTECRTCHTSETCLECHIGTPEVARDLLPAGPGRGIGAIVQRAPPASHQGGFRDRHASAAAAAPQTCAGCHVRSDCLDCHRPSAASASPGYHSADFLSRHPSAAYAREGSCSDCHNPMAFCATCHQTAGLVAQRDLGSGYHDAKQFFVVGHGQAARQSLETCVSCHTESDCLTCHSALAGRGFNPHGPDFDAERLRKRNSEVCAACHGTAIPGSP